MAAPHMMSLDDDDVGAGGGVERGENLIEMAPKSSSIWASVRASPSPTVMEEPIGRPGEAKQTMSVDLDTRTPYIPPAETAGTCARAAPSVVPPTTPFGHSLPELRASDSVAPLDGESLQTDVPRGPALKDVAAQESSSDGQSGIALELPPTASLVSTQDAEPDTRTLLLTPGEAPTDSVTSGRSGRSSGCSSNESATSGTTVKQLYPTSSHRSRSWPRSRSDLSGSFQDSLLKHLDRHVARSSPPTSLPTSLASLGEFAHLVRLQKHLSAKHRRLQARAYRCMVVEDLLSRLSRSGVLAQRSLVDFYKQDDRRGFATLYSALHDVRDSCSASRRYAFIEPELDVRMSAPAKDELDALPPSFLDQLPHGVKDDLLELVSRLRTDPDFLASRLMSLPAADLVALASSSQALDPLNSVMSAHHFLKSQSSARRSLSYAPSPVERLLSFQRRDPLSALLFTIFAESGGPQAAEDLRRLELWSTVCAKMINDRTSGNEQFMRAVFNAWSALRDWPFKANLELYLMGILQEGAFILDLLAKRNYEAASFSGTGGAQDLTRIDKFYDQAISQLFALLGDQEIRACMPLGVYEIGNAILRRLRTPEKQQAARILVVCKWFFSNFLLDAMIFPEAHGMMAGCHISPSARQRILKEVAVRAQRHVWDVSFDWKPLKPIPLDVRCQIERILQSVSPSAFPIQLSRFPPVRSVPSPQETFEARAFLVLCPSDIVTLVNALFPEPRPSSSDAGSSLHLQSLPSATSPNSGTPLPTHTGFETSPAADISSTPSNSGSSVTSETVSQGPSLERFGQQPDGMSSCTSVESRHTLLDTHRSESVASFGQRLRSHLTQLPTFLGPQTAAGTSHPCAEAWAVLHISSDGKTLDAVVPADVEDDEAEDIDETCMSLSEDGTGATIDVDLERRYHDLKAVVTHLVDLYDVPDEVPSDVKPKILSNRFSTFNSSSKQPGNIKPNLDVRSENQAISEEISASAEDMTDQPPSGIADTNALAMEPKANANSLQSPDESQLLAMLEAAVDDCRARLDFSMAHYFWEALERLGALSSTSLGRDQFAPLLTYFARGPRNAIRKLASLIENHEARLLWLQQAHDRRDASVRQLMTTTQQLRNKMWYATDVRHSGPYEEAKNVAAALKHMGETPRSSKTKSSFSFLPRNFVRTSVGTLLLKAEAQVLSLLTASPEHGGMAKLSDEQSEMTQHWLRQRNIVNFCKGEERIHRFCFEVDKCVNRLVGYDITTAPVLWSSELFGRDKLVLESGYQQGGLRVNELGIIAPAGVSALGSGSQRSLPRAADWMERPAPQSARSENHFQHGLDPGFRRLGGSKQPLDFRHSYRQVPATNLPSTVRASETFWSPFLGRRSSAATHATRTWPRAFSDQGSAALKNLDGASLEADRFLRELKQDLTGLLLSDLGMTVWGRGSETDVWFSSEVGEDFLKGLDNQSQRVPAARAANPSDNAARGRERDANVPSSPLSQTSPGDTSPTPPPPSQSSQTSQVPAVHQPAAEGVPVKSSADVPGTTAATDTGFSFSSACERLLQLFSLHPNPYTKLHALQQLVNLTTLSNNVDLPSSNAPGPQPRPGQDTHATPRPRLGSPSPMINARGPKTKGLRDVGASCEQRRSQTIRRKRLPSPWRQKATAPFPPTDTSADIQDVARKLQRLFRDSKTRPKSLFRDFQFIASFVPGQVLDETDSGRAFWNASLAALGLKQHVCRMMVEMADKIVAHHTKTRTVEPSETAAAAGVGTGAGASAGAPADEVSRFHMADAARMLTIPAKEGDAVAQRELAIFYLTHPDLVARTTFPLSRPRDIFTSQMMNQRDEDPARSDPATMCVAYHWMELSSQGGDELARQYLRAREELNALP